MTVTEIRNILEAPYDRAVWKDFIKTQFTNNNLLANDTALNLGDSELYKECHSLGYYTVDEYTKIGIFEVQLADKVKLSRNRVALRNLINDITAQVSGAMVVFVQGDKWRFSYVSKRKVKNKETNTIEDKETAPKRYTYLFGKGEKALTAAQRFDKLIQKQQGNLYQYLTLNDFEEAFSVEKLGKDFFKSYKDIYEDFVEYITGVRFVKKGSKWTASKVHEPHFDFHDIFKNDDKAVRDFFKRMLGRIVFLYFIQKKGWLAVPQDKKWGEGNPDYLYQLFKNAKYKELFYSDYLVPLFYETLNDPKSESETKDLRFPYLNGGLFDKSQDFQYDKLALPSSIFEKLFDTFNIYNFTVYEDAPDEHTIAVDPEMLGHIFENLLEDNKDKGAFYTPKEIVHYMCKESLKSYLLTQEELKTTDDAVAQNAIDKIIQQQDLTAEEAKYAEKYAFKIIDKLKEVKICDPAIGSGAFPMGLLQEIFNAQIFLMELSGFTKKVADAEIKKHIIEESIYGVDIEPGAVDIARLRFWLSLVVDEPVPQPLPNLSFKIVCANTLIPLGTPVGDLGGSKEIADKIEKIREKYFSANKEDKRALEMEFRNLQNKLWTTANEWATGNDAIIYKKINEFNPFEDKSCSWFDPWWMFGVKDGFDIVIGNPPYVVPALSKMEKDNYKSNYKSALYQINLYLLFVEKGNILLKNEGILSYIIPNTWLINKAVANYRKILIEELDILSIVDLTFEKVFEATVLPVILLLSKRESKVDLIPIYNFKNGEIYLENELSKSEISVEDNYLINYQIDKSKKNIIQEIDKNTTPLARLAKSSFGVKFYQVNKGKPKQTREIVDNHSYTHTEPINENCLKILEGKDVNKYSMNFSGKYIEYGLWLAEPRNPEMFRGERILLRRIVGEKGLIATIINGNYCNNSLLHIIKPLNDDINNINSKYLLSIINSRLIGFYFISKFARKEKTFPEIRIHELESLPIKIHKNFTPFSNLVDYLLYLNDSESTQILPHTSNERIASHIEDVLNMMVYELYFEDHMKEVGIDVLQFIDPKPFSNSQNDLEKAEIIKAFYEWLQTPNNEVRQRINIVDIKSPDIISKINLATQ